MALGFDVAVRAHLERLAGALGGEWAFAEVAGSGLRAIATTAGLAADLTGPDWSAAMGRTEGRGIVVRIDSGPGAHPSAARDPSGTARPRFLLGDRLAGGCPDERTAAVLALVGDLMAELARAASRAEEDRSRAAHLEMRASTDPLTGLLNRRGWDRLIAVEEDRCRRHGLLAEVTVVDLDGLKLVNDAHGHEAGDGLLVRTATHIVSAVRMHDAVARLGGDEFAVLAVGTTDGTEKVGEHVEACLAGAGIDASVGSATRTMELTVAGAWRLADLRMYRAKQRRRRAGHRSDDTAGTPTARDSPGGGSGSREAGVPSGVPAVGGHSPGAPV